MSEQTKRDSFALKGALIFFVGLVVGGLGMHLAKDTVREQSIESETYPNGQKKWEGELEDGLEQGLWKFYREDGTIFGSGEFVEGVQVGNWTTYDGSGKKSWEGAVDQYGLSKGEQRVYDSAGRLRGRDNFKDGIAHGESLGFSPNGKRVWQVDFKNGFVHGEAKEWDSDGTLRFVSEYKNGVPHGKHITYGLNGDKIELNYVDGRVVIED